MRIDQWPMDKIMQLPDWCFGRRWVVRFCAYVHLNSVKWLISPDALPEMTLVWSINYLQVGSQYSPRFIDVALGDTVPVNDAEWYRLERVCEVKSGGFEDGTLVGGAACAMYKLELRLPLAVSGRRFVVRFDCSQSEYANWLACDIVISSMPREIPEWLTWAEDAKMGHGFTGRS